MSGVVWICEKPSQGRDLAAVLGAEPGRHDGYIPTARGTVTWCVGHLLEQAAPEAYDPALKRWDLKQLPIIPAKWLSVPVAKRNGQLAVITRLLAKACSVVVATDADREGELIAREILEHVNYRGPVKRLWITALDPQSIRKALNRLRPGAETVGLFHAARARSRADWLIGMNLTRAATLHSGGRDLLSVGRVQTPTLALVVRRDREIEGFKSRTYFELAAQVTAEGHRLSLRHRPPSEPEDCRIYDRKVAEGMAQAAQGVSAPLQVTVEQKMQRPPKLFSLAGLQKACDQRFGWPVSKTLKLAQALYEQHKIVTYPRSDCSALPEEQIADVPEIVAHLLQQSPLAAASPVLADPVIRKSVFDSAKVTAHHAIIPTLRAADLEQLSSEETQLYLLIARSYLAALAPDCQYEQRTIRMMASGVEFRARGRTDLVTGWKGILDEPKEKDQAKTKDSADDEPAVRLPPVKNGAMASVERCSVVNCKTSPPAHYTEGSLLDDMAAVAKYAADPRIKARLKETSGLGTEATRAAIIDVLRKRAFLERKGRQIRSTELGRSLVDRLPKPLSDAGTTALWEDQLEAIANSGALDAEQQFVNAVQQQIVRLLGLMGAIAEPVERQ